MATLKEVAEEAGVSVSTVSKILNGQNKENRPTAISRASHVREVAAKLNYRPNGAARAVLRGSFNCVAIVQDDQDGRSNLPNHMLDGIHDALAEHGKRVSFGRISDELAVDDVALPNLMDELYADGLLVNINTHVPERMVELVARHGLPAVWLNSPQANDCVRPDDFGAAVALTRKLLAEGHRHIGYTDFVYHTSTRHYSREDRLRGYTAAMQEADLAPIFITQPIARSKVIDVQKRRALVEAHPQLTALLSYSSADLQELWLAGYGVGESIAYGTFAYPGDHALPIYAAIVPHYQVGRVAALMLLAKLEHPEEPLPTRSIPFEIRDCSGTIVQTQPTL